MSGRYLYPACANYSVVWKDDIRCYECVKHACAWSGDAAPAEWMKDPRPDAAPVRFVTPGLGPGGLGFALLFVLGWVVIFWTLLR